MTRKNASLLAALAALVLVGEWAALRSFYGRAPLDLFAVRVCKGNVS